MKNKIYYSALILLNIVIIFSVYIVIENNQNKKIINYTDSINTKINNAQNSINSALSESNKSLISATESISKSNITIKELNEEKFNKTINLGINAEDMLGMINERYPKKKFSLDDIKPFIFPNKREIGIPSLSSFSAESNLLPIINNIAKTAIRLLQDESYRARMISELKKTRSKLGEPGAYEKAACCIENFVR